MRQNNAIAKVGRKTALASLLVIGSSFSAAAVAGPLYTPWTDASIVTFSRPQQDPTTYIPFSDAQYIWYCGPGVESCAGDDKWPAMVHFRSTFFVPDVAFSDPDRRSEITVVADDYYALYINGVFFGESWLEDKNAATRYDIDFDLLRGRDGDGYNQIDIFACDGFRLPGANAGPTLADGFDACDGSSFVNHWLLVGGGYIYADEDEAENRLDFTSGSGVSFWQARAVQSVPVPGSLFLIALGFCAFAARFRHRGRGRSVIGM